MGYEKTKLVAWRVADTGAVAGVGWVGERSECACVY